MKLFFSFITKVKSNRIFKFVSSVKLAVPLMLTVGFAVAYGTIVESRYNAEMAKMLVYQAWWFQILMGLLWVNIFASTISRIPYKIHHLGFVITHLGLLTLLIGALVTAETGVDGQLRVVENTANDTIILPDLVLEMATPESVQPESYGFVRQAHELSGSDLNFLNNKIADRIVVMKYAPFVKVESEFRRQNEGDHGVALGFILKSQFFNQSEWLHSREKSELQLGPAHLRMIEHARTQSEPKVKKVAIQASPKKSTPAKEHSIEVRKKIGDELVTRIAIAKLKKAPVKISGGLTISFKKQYEQAIVSQGGVSEGGEPGKNPAIEIEVDDGKQKQREVLYAKFPNFSLHADGISGMSFTFSDPNMPTEKLQQNAASPHGGASMGGDTDSTPNIGEASANSPRGMGNEIEFHVYKDQPEKVRVALYKEGKQVLSQWAESGKVIQTPWMGITITIGNIQMNSANQAIVTSIEHPLRTNIPPAALQVKLPGTPDDQAFWLIEGEPKRLSRAGKEFEVYFGRKTLRLPFNIHLEKFYKKDYPGTQTPISYESDVHVNNLPGKIKIAMNEPLQYAGYVLYQASYEMNPGQPPASIFSVNQDPGRSTKYTGSLILVLGIIIFTVMRSSKYKQWRNLK